MHIKLKFEPREYQKPIMDAILNKGYKRVLAIMPRRAGKDMTAFNICIQAMLEKTMVCYYILPTFAMGKKILWDSITNTGERIIEYLPQEFIESSNSQEMKIKLVNGSLFQIIGSDSYDHSLIGTNPQLCVFSEYSLQDPRAYQFVRPILAANEGTCLMISTPRGKNHLWELAQIAQQSPNWFYYRITLDDTKHIPLEEIEKERQEGIMSEDLIQQEYYVSFSMGVEGSYYSKYLDKMRLNNQITRVPWDPTLPVHTSWDIGVRDSTSIIMYQISGVMIRIIDCYENNKQGLEHYKQVLDSKPYSWGKHFAPHDIGVTEWGSGMSRLEKARQMGLKFEYRMDAQSRAVSALPNVSIMDGIEAVRTVLPRCWIDDMKCISLIKALESYRQEYDHRLKVYTTRPLHDWSSHMCFTADTLIITRRGLVPIAEVRDCDEVLTRDGFKQCTKSLKTMKEAPLVEVTFADKTKVRCTPDHQFFTMRGLFAAKDLKKSMYIQSAPAQFMDYLNKLCIRYGNLRNQFETVKEEWVDIYARLLINQLQDIFSFVGQDIRPLVYVEPLKYMCNQEAVTDFLEALKEDISLLLTLYKKESLFKDLKKAGIECNNVSFDIDVEFYPKHTEQSARNVNRAFKNIYGTIDVPKEMGVSITRNLMISKVTELKNREDVYDIYVPTYNHFSLANGAIVHNCDAMRYLALSLPKTKDGLSKEELDKNYQRAVYGEQGTLPRFFRDERY